MKKSTLKAEKSRPGWALGALGGDLGKKNVHEAVLADFGQARDAQNGGKMAELGAKMGPRWRLAILWPIGELSWAFCGVLGTIFAEMAEV